MKFPRKSGILFHISSLPSKYGIGDMGIEAREFIDFLADSKQSLWQVLPLNPVDEYNSPYKSPCVFAGNTMLISFDIMVEDGYLNKEDLMDLPDFSDGRVDFLKVRKLKEILFKKAFLNFKSLMDTKVKDIKSDYESFVSCSKYWIDNFALYISLSKLFKSRDWTRWNKELANRDEKILNEYKEKLSEEIYCEKFLQYIFHRQWKELRKYANDRGIRIIGDVPIYTSLESADVWSHQELFNIDSKGNPLTVAGVPPDDFSETGQLWENPIYRWDEMANYDFLWWRKRIENSLEKHDIIRLDHFRGFEAYWEVPFGDINAVNGKWSKGPGYGFFLSLKKYLGEIPVIAEDLGHITEEVCKLKNKLGYPGMRILQFENMDDFESENFLDSIDSNTVCYTGTHDNDTLYGWYEKAYEKSETIEYMCNQLIKKLFKCSADIVIIPVQDLLLIDSNGRMNIPGTKYGNWAWKLTTDKFNNDLIKGKAESLAELTTEYGRV
jgi:4-alpha-glucanotransferase